MCRMFEGCMDDIGYGACPMIALQGRKLSPLSVCQRQRYLPAQNHFAGMLFDSYDLTSRHDKQGIWWASNHIAGLIPAHRIKVFRSASTNVKRIRPKPLGSAKHFAKGKDDCNACTRADGYA